jgi:DHA2 family multidrug resistance protein-like MFS transporter
MMTTAPRERSGAAGGMLATARLTGQTAGAVLTAIMLHLFPHRAGRITLAIGAALAIVAAAISLSRRAGSQSADRGDTAALIMD